MADTWTLDATDNGDGTWTLDSPNLTVTDGVWTYSEEVRDIDVTASPIFSGWSAGLITAYPETTGPVFPDDDWKPGKVTRNPETAGALVNQVTAGAVWIQE